MMIRTFTLSLLLGAATAAVAQVQRIDVTPGNIVANEFSLDVAAAANLAGSTTFTLKILNNNRLKGREVIGVWLSGGGFRLPLRMTKEIGGFETIRFTVPDTHVAAMTANVGFGSARNDYAREYRFSLAAFKPVAGQQPAPVSVPPLQPLPDALPAAPQPVAPQPAAPQPATPAVPGS